jgi:hypothetical protein
MWIDMKDDQRLNRSGADVAVFQDDTELLALRALTYVVGDVELGRRLLDLTGLDVTGLRARAADPAVLAATLQFLAAHEPSLIACAAALDVRPAALVAAEHALAERSA